MKKELIKRIEALPAKDGKGRPFVDKKIVIGLIQTMDEPKQPTLANIIHRIKFMEEDLKQEWLSKILKELGSDFELKKFQEGFKSGSWIGRQLINADKIRQKLNKPVIPQFVADWYEEHKDILEYSLFDYVYKFDKKAECDFKDWLNDFKTEAFQTLVNMHQFGYEVEKEPKYLVKLKNVPDHFGILNFGKHSKEWLFSDSNTNSHHRTAHTRKELEEAGFGEVFNSTLFEVEEVEEVE
jgi:gp178|nr:MAG TPA: Protein of unknown function (DUF1642) [Caudoviricetes sp.]